MAKKNNDYWQGRFEQLEKASHQEALKTYAEIEQYFNQAQREIEKQINSWYVRFANNNEITMADAKRLLNSNELKEFKWDVQEYIKYGHENEMNESWMKELENASAKYHISRLEALKLQTQQSMEVLFGNELDEVDKMASNVYTKNYYHTMFEMQKGFNVGFNIASIDDNKLSKIITKPWAVDEKNFSERIWENKTKMINELHNQLTRMCVQGKSPDEVIKYMSKKFNTSKAQAGNLVMTESAYFSQLAQKDCFKDLDVEKYEIVATLDSRTSEICQEQDGQIYDMKDYQPGVTAPPFHNYCRSTTVPYFEDDYDIKDTRAARDAEGKTYYVENDVKYKDWCNQNIKDNLKKSTKSATINNKEKLTLANLPYKLNINLENYNPFDDNVQEKVASYLNIDTLPTILDNKEFENYNGKEIIRVVHDYQGLTAEEAYNNTLYGNIRYSEVHLSGYGRGMYFGDKEVESDILSTYSKGNSKIINAKIANEAKILEFENEMDYIKNVVSRLQNAPVELQKFYEKETSLLFILDDVDGIKIKSNNYYCIYNRGVLKINV